MKHWITAILTIAHEGNWLNPNLSKEEIVSLSRFYEVERVEADVIQNVFLRKAI